MSTDPVRDSVRFTISSAERLESIARRPTRARERRPRARRVDVSASVNPSVWRQALALAGGDASRIEVVSPLEVVVR